MSKQPYGHEPHDMKFKLDIGPDAEADIKSAANWYRILHASRRDREWKFAVPKP